MAKLYPPYLEGTLPAFYLDANGDGELTIPFAHNKAVSKSEIGGIAVKVKTIQNDYLIANFSSTDRNSGASGNYLNYGEIIFPINNFTACDGSWENIKIGQYYKIQIAYKDLSGVIGHYSTVGVIKCTSKPNIYIQDFDKDAVNNSRTEFIGIFEQPAGGDVSEKVYSSKFEITDMNNNIIESTGDILHNIENNPNSYSSIDTMSFNRDLKDGEIYKIRYSVVTTNSGEVSSPWYFITQQRSLSMTLKGDLNAELNYDEGFIDISILSYKDSHGIEEIGNGNFVLAREDSINPGVWEEMHRFSLKYESPAKTIFRDFTIEQGKRYTYSLQQYNENHIFSERKKSNVIYADFEDMFLFDGEKQLKLRFNPQVSNFKTQLSETKSETIGSKYPFFFRNAQVGYKVFPINALISMLSDDNEYFTDFKSILRDDFVTERHNIQLDKQVHPQTRDKDNDLSSNNYTSERLFKMKVLDWFNNGKVKLFRSPSEGNFLVRLMDSSLNAQATLGRMLHDISATAYECAECNYKNLIKYSIISSNNNISGDEAVLVTTWFEKDFGGYQFYSNINDGYHSTNLLEADISGIYTQNLKLEDFVPGTQLRIVFDPSGVFYKDSYTENSYEDIVIGSTGSYYVENLDPYVYGIYLINNSKEYVEYLEYKKFLENRDDKLKKLLGTEDYNLYLEFLNFIDSFYDKMLEPAGLIEVKLSISAFPVEGYETYVPNKYYYVNELGAIRKANEPVEDFVSTRKYYREPNSQQEREEALNQRDNNLSAAKEIWIQKFLEKISAAIRNDIENNHDYYYNYPSKFWTDERTGEVVPLGEFLENWLTEIENHSDTLIYNTREVLFNLLLIFAGNGSGLSDVFRSENDKKILMIEESFLKAGEEYLKTTEENWADNYSDSLSWKKDWAINNTPNNVRDIGDWYTNGWDNTFNQIPTWYNSSSNVPYYSSLLSWDIYLYIVDNIKSCYNWLPEDSKVLFNLDDWIEGIAGEYWNNDDEEKTKTRFLIGGSLVNSWRQYIEQDNWPLADLVVVDIVVALGRAILKYTKNINFENILKQQKDRNTIEDISWQVLYQKWLNWQEKLKESPLKDYPIFFKEFTEFYKIWMQTFNANYIPQNDSVTMVYDRPGWDAKYEKIYKNGKSLIQELTDIFTNYPNKIDQWYVLFKEAKKPTACGSLNSQTGLISYQYEVPVRNMFDSISNVNSNIEANAQFVGVVDNLVEDILKVNGVDNIREEMSKIYQSNYHKRPVEWLYQKDQDMFSTSHPSVFSYEDTLDGYRKNSENIPQLYWNNEFVSVFTDEDSMNHSPFSIYLVRNPLINGENYVDHIKQNLINSIDGYNSTHVENHMFEKYYIDAILRSEDAEDILTQYSILWKAVEDHRASLQELFSEGSISKEVRDNELNNLTVFWDNITPLYAIDAWTGKIYKVGKDFIYDPTIKFNNEIIDLRKIEKYSIDNIETDNILISVGNGVYGEVYFQEVIKTYDLEKTDDIVKNAKIDWVIAEENFYKYRSYDYYVNNLNNSVVTSILGENPVASADYHAALLKNLIEIRDDAYSSYLLKLKQVSNTWLSRESGLTN